MIQRQSEYDVVVVGGSGVDTIVRVDALPVPLADSVMVGPIQEWAGQTGGNVALGARALGLDVALLDCIGDDPTGALVRERLAEGDVEFHPLISAAGTRRAVNLVDAKGRRMSFYDARDPAELRMPRTSTCPGCGAPAMSTCPSRASPDSCTTTSRPSVSPSPPICTTGTESPSTSGSSPCGPISSSSAPRPRATAPPR